MELPLVRPAPSKVPPRAVLWTGLASAVVLAAAAWQPFADPGASARLEQARLASDAAEGLAAEWDLLLRGADAPVPGSLEATLELTLPAAAHPVDADATSTVSRALLAEAERVELAQNDLPEALALVEESLSKSPSRAELARGRLRAVQIAARLQRDDDVRRHFAAAAAELDGTELADGASALALLVLAAGNLAADDARSVACARIARLSDGGALALPGADPTLVVGDELFGDDAVVAVPDARRAAFETLLRERCTGFRSDPVVAPALRAAAGPAMAHAMLHAKADAWSVRRTEVGLAFARATSDIRVRVAVASDARVEQRLRDVAARFLAGGVALDASGESEDLGVALRSPVELVPGVLSVTLRHHDPASIATGARRRATWLRAGILALAASIAAAAVFAHRALSRERRLADLRSRFVANVSHELRTPVASILLMAENLEAGRVPDGSAPRYHAAIRGEALRLRRLVEDVLDFSRVERGRRIAVDRAETDLDAWARTLGADLRDVAERHTLELAFDDGAPLGRANVDGEALRRVALNLVDNAAKHSGARRVDVALRGDDARFVLSVRDHGRGIPAARRDEVFEPFARLDEDRGAPGAGLGLAIVREIAQAHGGSARAIHPTDGPGALLEVAIPRDAPETAT